MKRDILVKMFCVALVLSCAFQGALAQEGSVEVFTDYRPEIAAAKKILAPTVIENDASVQPQIVYQVQPSSWQLALEAHNFLPARAFYWDYNNYKRLYANAAVGFPLGSELGLNYTFQTPKTGYLGIGIDHVGDFAKRSYNDQVRPIAESYNMRNGAKLFGGVFINRYLLDFAVAYDSDIYNGYAMQSPEHRVFNDVNVGVRFGDEFANLSRLNFEVKAYAGLWKHGMAISQQSIDEKSLGASAKLARAFGSNILSLDLSFDQRTALEDNLYSDMRIGARAGYVREFGIFNVEVGLGYLYATRGGHFLPKAKLTLSLCDDTFLPYLEFDSEVRQNSPSSLFGRNPYIDYDVVGEKMGSVADTRSYNLTLGFKESLLSSHIVLHAFVGFRFMKDELFWFVTRDGMFGFDTAKNTRTVMGINADFIPATGLHIDLDFSYQIDKNKSVYELPEPKLRGALGIEYAVSKWKLYARGELHGARSWSVLSAVEGEPMGLFTMDNCFDLSAGVSYRVSRIAEIYLKGENLLGSKIYDFANYYRPGAGGMIGVRVDF